MATIRWRKKNRGKIFPYTCASRMRGTVQADFAFAIDTTSSRKNAGIAAMSVRDLNGADNANDPNQGKGTNTNFSSGKIQ